MILAWFYIAGIAVCFLPFARFIFRDDRRIGEADPVEAVCFGLFASFAWPLVFIVLAFIGFCKLLGPLVTWRNG